jgi:O-antigen ligase
VSKLNSYFLGLFFIYPFFGYFAVMVNNTAADSLTSLLFLLLFALNLMASEQKRFPRYLVFYCFFVLYTVIWDFVNGTISEAGMIKYFYQNHWINTITVLYVIENTYFTERMMRLYQKLLWFVFAAAVFIILIQVTFNPRFFVNPGRMETVINKLDDSRFPSIFSYISNVSGSLSFGIMASILLALALLRRQIVHFLVSIMAVVFSIATRTRSSMLAIIIALMGYFAYTRTRKRVVFRNIFLILIILTASYYTLSFLNVDVDKIYNERIIESDKGGFESTSAYTRIFAFELFANQFPKAPIFGTGGSQSIDLQIERGGRTSQIHVGWLSLLYYFGAVGFILYFIFFYSIMRRFWHIAKETQFWGSFIGMMIFIFVNMTYVYYYLFEMGIFLTFIYNKYFEQVATEKYYAR